jgi:hypothetical protein
MSEWISVEVRLPDMRKPYKDAAYVESERVLIFNGHYSQIGKYAQTYTAKKTRWEADGRVAKPTHWMPLPDPPTKS